MNEPDPPANDPIAECCWEQGWEGHERAQRRRMASLSLAEKLDWLEAAQKMVEHMREAKPQSWDPASPK
jgi:hypothetical protein